MRAQGMPICLPRLRILHADFWHRLFFLLVTEAADRAGEKASGATMAIRGIYPFISVFLLPDLIL